MLFKQILNNIKKQHKQVFYSISIFIIIANLLFQYGFWSSSNTNYKYIFNNNYIDRANYVLKRDFNLIPHNEKVRLLIF